MSKRRCAASTSKGQSCCAWAVHNTEPPLCSAHGGGERPVGAPSGNNNAEVHGFYSQRRPSPGASMDSDPDTSSRFYLVDPDLVTINDAVADLTDKPRRLDRLMAQQE